ncbi:MAG: DUF4190 domain-containing protein [Planctomycetes bacterium]|nr:DUF4190 domain-containing protein [Planctomycetota bacterium]
MPVPFRCPHCGQETQVADIYVGRTGPCSGCGKTVTIPDPRNPFSDVLGPGYSPPPHSVGDDPAMRILLPVGRSLWAIAAGYAGLFSLFCAAPGPIAVVLGLIAIRDIRQHPDRHGMGRAVFAIVTGVFGTIVLGVLLVVMLING